MSSGSGSQEQTDENTILPQIADLKVIVSSLAEQVDKLSALIKMLINKLSFVLSLLGITEDNNQSQGIAVTETAFPALPQKATASMSSMSGSSCSSPTTDNSTVLSAATTSQISGEKHISWSQVAAAGVDSQEKKRNLFNNYRNSIIAAVYTDQQEEVRQGKTFIVNGLSV